MLSARLLEPSARFLVCFRLSTYDHLIKCLSSDKGLVTPERERYLPLTSRVRVQGIGLSLLCHLYHNCRVNGINMGK